MKKFIFSFYKAIIIAILIIILSLISSHSFNKFSFINFKYADKIVHFLMYFGFTLFLAGGYKKFYLLDKLNLKSKIIIIFIAIIFGLVIEILQLSITKTRAGETLDFIANAVGTIFAVFIYHSIIKTYYIKSIIE